MKLKQLVAATALTAMSAVTLAEEPMMVNVKRMSLETALKIAQGAIEACRKEGIQIGVTVVDRDGIAQVVMRDTIAPTITLPISQGKAYAAVMFNVATSGLNDRANTPIGRAPGVDVARWCANSSGRLTDWWCRCFWCAKWRNR